MTPANFRKIVWAYYKKHGRHDLPWRDKTLDLYHVLVSEIMLQQTQVDRVIPFYKNFIKQFPTAKKLAKATLSEVLIAWQGLGYNRRAKLLHQAAKQLSDIHNSTYRTKNEDVGTGLVEELEKLPGVGPYTARAVAAFAYNQDVIVIETNIRTAVIHHLFPKKKKVSDKEIEKILVQALPKGLPAGRQGRAREWYSALMDYGASLKRSGISHNLKSKTYTKQSKFAGSLREARGAILRELTSGAASPIRLINVLGASRRAQMRTALRALWTEGLIEKSNENYTLST